MNGVQYEATCRYFCEGGRTPWTGLLVAGGMAGIAGWVATFPLDLVKTRMQSTEAGSLVWTVVHAYRTEGPRVFLRGLAPTVIRWVARRGCGVCVYPADFNCKVRAGQRRDVFSVRVCARMSVVVD